MNDIPQDIVKPTRERMRKALGYDELTETQAGGVVKKSGGLVVWTPLENLYRNGGIDSYQRQAGIKFGVDHFLGYQAGKSVTMRWQEYISGYGAETANLDAAERRVFHIKRFQEADKILIEMSLRIRRVVHMFTIYDENAIDIGRAVTRFRAANTKSASATTLIQEGLNRLARFYGIIR